MSERKYSGKDSDMLIAISTIIEAAIANKIFLQSKRSTWADPFFDNIKTRIDTAIQNFLGVDNAKDLRAATQAVEQVQNDALDTLAEFKTQLMEDFSKDKPRRDELLNLLGFKSYLKAAQSGDQEGMISLLYQFKVNMTPALQTEITAKGTDPATITTITGYADTLKNSNVSQEGFKAGRKNITKAILDEFNEIYSMVKSVGVIAAKFYKGNPEMQDGFSYNRTIKALNKQPSSPKKLIPA